MTATAPASKLKMLVVNTKEGQESSLRSNVELPQICDTDNAGACS